ncbi:DUF2970 domain-containing protein [Lacimicrobium sp. SS2-24]|uniref:DUF2970 domain-containing protein n=1 Tax=Lacimicrobium sp. SS2-24 TaxID=2005569 RepID=UPI000B4C1F2B|nr:DUF2970 domain-containing protein [Lacimicrobium sp. SS2-24]
MTESRLSWWEVVKSVAASMFGVQSEKKRQADFSSHQSIVPFLIVGVIFVAVFVISLIIFVKWLIPG